MPNHTPPPPQESPGRTFFLKYTAGWRRIVSNFSPSWFSITMGTGIVGILFHMVPFGHDILRYFSIVFFILNTLLFITVFTMSALRYTLYPEIWGVMIQDPINSLFLATCPMGFATLIELWVLICVPSWGKWARVTVWALWVIDAIVAAAVTASLSFVLMSRNYITSLDRITAIQLLPIAATIVASGTGAEVAEILDRADYAKGTVMACYILWGMATPMALMTLVIYYQRLAVHKLPSRETIVSCFLPLGPLGFGGYSILYLGKVTRHLLGANTSFLDPIAGDLAYVFGVFVSLLMWSFGLIWLIFALATIYYTSPFPFNMGWWGFTFPLGVYAASTIQLGIEMDLAFFKILGTIFSVLVLLLWMVVAVRTVIGAWHGTLFFAPCLQNLKSKTEEDVEREQA